MNIETINGRRFAVAIEYDDAMGAPWEENDGHGTVSEWTRRDKRPGELELCEDRGSRRFYDYAGAVRIAKTQWIGTGNKGFFPSETLGQRAAKLARDDYEHLRAWCNDQWQWVYVDVQALDENDEPTGARDSLGGVKSTRESLLEITRELAANCIAAELAEIDSIQAALSTAREHVRAWLAEYRHVRTWLGSQHVPHLCDTARKALQREIKALNVKRARARLLRELNANATETAGA